MLKGIQKASKKNGEIYYRSSITYKSKHISLGSYATAESANAAYLQAHDILDCNLSISEYFDLKFKEGILKFDKVISLINLRQNGVYFVNPIFLMKKYFYYYLSPDEIMTFDAEDLFYYAHHKIQKRGNRLFVADYGMQVTLQTRYGIKPYAVFKRDYEFLNGDPLDFRYENIMILSKYTGVLPIRDKNMSSVTKYKVKIHFKGNYTVGIFSDEATAAVAYNKAADFINAQGFKKNYNMNYVEEISAREYADIYTSINISNFSEKFIKHNSDN